MVLEWGDLRQAIMADGPGRLIYFFIDFFIFIRNLSLISWKERFQLFFRDSLFYNYRVRVII